VDTPADFWAWFERRVLPFLARAEVPPAPLIDELDRRVLRLGCAWELGPAPEDRPGWAFAVSFGADLQRLAVAETVVRCAPPMAGCAVLLGKPPKQWDGTLNLRSGGEWVQVQTTTWTCHWFAVAGGVAVVVVPTEVPSLDDAEMLSAAEIAVQAVLGELAFARMVRDVSVARTDGHVLGAAVPLRDLARHLLMFYG
jgi:hypothetical protein